MGNEIRILVLENDPCLTSLLEAEPLEGIRLKTALPECGLESIQANKLYLVLLNMTGQDLGWLHHLNQEGALKSARFLVFDDQPAQDRRLAFFQAGALAVISLPCPREELIARIRVFQGLKQSAEVDQLKWNFLSILGHEMLTLLTGILTPLEMVQAETEWADKEGAEDFEMVMENAIFLEQVVKRALELGVLGLDNKDLRDEIGELDTLVARVVDHHRPETMVKKLDLHTEIAPGARVGMHNTYLEDAVGILLAQAIRFSPPGKTVSVRLRLVNDSCELAITDEGQESLGEDLSRLFDVFNRYSTLSRNVEGHGIALTLAAQIARGHQGNLEVKQERGQGTTFTLTLPLEKVSATSSSGVEIH